MDKQTLKTLIDTAAGREPADLVIKNGKIADVFSCRVLEGDIAVAGGLIAALGGSYEGKETLDARGRYVIPGLIESHIHIESSFLCPEELGRLLVPQGTATIVADPHEIVNVSGIPALNYMMEAASGSALDIKFMIPSCVPSASFEDSGALVDAAAMEEPLKRPGILGLGEFMNYPGVIAGEDGVLDKLILALNAGKLIDGHSPGLGGKGLAAYAAAFIHTDHECATVEEMEARISRGMYVMLREGSACRDLKKLLPGLSPQNSRRCVLCSDDLQPRTILEEGHLDRCLRLCIREGVDPFTALQMATLNTAECFRLYDRGAIAPGRRADLVVVNSLEEFRADEVFIQGKLCARGGRYLPPVKRAPDQAVRNSVKVKDFSVEKLALKLSKDEVHVIDILPEGVVTGKGRAKVKRDPAGFFVYDPALDIAKIAVIERHKMTGRLGLGLIRNYGIKTGAVALSVGHDSHNIITLGVRDEDMAAAVERLIALEGGAVLVNQGQVIEEMALPLGGIMSGESGEWVRRKLTALHRRAVEELGVSPGVEPLMTLCFMALTVIPALKISTRGLFDVGAFGFIPLETPD